jgi:hypothetical protein
LKLRLSLSGVELGYFEEGSGCWVRRIRERRSMLLRIRCLLGVDRLVQSRSCSIVPSLSIAIQSMLANDIVGVD